MKIHGSEMLVVFVVHAIRVQLYTSAAKKKNKKKSVFLQIPMYISSNSKIRKYGEPANIKCIRADIHIGAYNKTSQNGLHLVASLSLTLKRKTVVVRFHIFRVRCIICRRICVADVEYSPFLIVVV